MAFLKISDFNTNAVLDSSGRLIFDTAGIADHRFVVAGTKSNIWLTSTGGIVSIIDGTPYQRAVIWGKIMPIWLDSSGKVCVTKLGSPSRSNVAGMLSNMRSVAGKLFLETYTNGLFWFGVLTNAAGLVEDTVSQFELLMETGDWLLKEDGGKIVLE